MKNKESVILQMLYGEKGKLIQLPTSEEYDNALNTLIKDTQEFKEKLNDYPTLLNMFKKLEDVFENENVAYANEVYKEAFSFGLALGQEVFGKCIFIKSE